jgi:hypothetical protein
MVFFIYIYVGTHAFHVLEEASTSTGTLAVPTEKKKTEEDEIRGARLYTTEKKMYRKNRLRSLPTASGALKMNKVPR